MCENNLIYSKKLLEMEKNARENFIQIIRPQTKEKLVQLIKENNSKNILEIGTAIGYSGSLILLNSKSDAKLTTIEKNAEMVKIAEYTFLEFGLKDRVNLVHADAIDFLEEAQKQNLKYDFIFLDGAKGQYIKYYPILKRLLNKNGTLFIDDILFYGLVNSEKFIEHKHRTIVVNLRKLIETINLDTDFVSEIKDIEDGYAILKKIGE